MPSEALRASSLADILNFIRNDYPEFSFIETTHFSWHAGHKVVSFKASGTRSEQIKDIWALLHELGHALLNHSDYRYDIELLRLEVEAWEKSHELAQSYGIEIDEDYVQDCLDTYRDWLHLRATCPTCYARSLQTSPRQYSCINCQAEWTVSRNRFCRPYRLQKTKEV
jgi:hypothetical protein